MPNLMLEHGIDKHYYTGSERFANQLVRGRLFSIWMGSSKLGLFTNIELISKSRRQGLYHDYCKRNIEGSV